MKTLFSQEHYDLIEMFDREFYDMRLDKEAKDIWAKGHIYQSDETNRLFLAYRKGCAFGRNQ